MTEPSRNGNGSMDQEPLKEPARTAFEKKLHAKYQLKGSVWHLLEVLLGRYFWGKADSYPSNKRLMEWVPDRQKRAVQRQLQKLRDAGVIRMFEDRSLISQRRLVLVDHPHAQPIIDSLVANPHVREMTDMHGLGGVKNDRCRGVKNDRCRGVKAVTPEPLTVEPERLNRNTVGTGGGNFSHLGTVNGQTGGPLASHAQEKDAVPFSPAKWSIEQIRRRAAGEAMFQSQDEMAIVRQLSSLSPGSSAIEVGTVALAVATLLGDRHSVKNWKFVAELARFKKISMEAFIGIAGTVKPGAVVMHRLKATIELEKAERAAKSKRNAKPKGARP